MELPVIRRYARVAQERALALLCRFAQHRLDTAYATGRKSQQGPLDLFHGGDTRHVRCVHGKRDTLTRSQSARAKRRIRAFAG